MPDPLDSWLDDSLADLDRRSLRRTLSERHGPQRGDGIEIDGQSLVNFGSNDYLGLAADPRIAAAAKAAIDECGWGAGASPLVTGRSELHAELERKLAEFEGTEAALLFPTGYAANVGTIGALVGKGDVIFSDTLNHASIIDGCRLSGAQVWTYPHRDFDRLSALVSHFANYRRRLIVTDSLFSMTGDLAPLPQIADLANLHRVMLLVDEAHATGVFGLSGRGVCEHFGIERDVHVRVGTLSKALGGFGGFVAGSKKLIDWLANKARPYMFSTAAPSAFAAAGLAALQVIREQPERRTLLLAHAQRLRAKLREAGIEVGASETQIVPVVLGDPDRTLGVAAELRRRGFFVPAIRPPSVPEGQSLLRISVTCLHTQEQICELVAALASSVG
jgi:8-amino-7-oxononanoate synthase